MQGGLPCKSGGFLLFGRGGLRMEESGHHPPFSQMGSTQISGKSGVGIQMLEERFPAGIGLFFCAVSLWVVIPLFSTVVLTDYRVADDFRLVGQIDFPTAQLLGAGA